MHMANIRLKRWNKHFILVGLPHIHTDWTDSRTSGSRTKQKNHQILNFSSANTEHWSDIALVSFSYLRLKRKSQCRRDTSENNLLFIQSQCYPEQTSCDFSFLWDLFSSEKRKQQSEPVISEGKKHKTTRETKVVWWIVWSEVSRDSWVCLSVCAEVEHAPAFRVCVLCIG